MKNMTTDNQKELLTQVDENNQIIGSIPRGEAHSIPGIFYRTIYIIVKNDQQEILLQKRSSTKDLYPDCWDLSVGGHVEFGQSYEDTAIRELKEELGIESNPSELKLVGEVLVKLPQSGEYFYVYEYRLKPNEHIKAVKSEVSDTKWMTIEDIKKSMKHQSLQWYERPSQVINSLYTNAK